MRRHLATLTLAVLSACNAESASTTSSAPVASLTDLSTSLAPLRADFNAHRGEARFLTLLSPTCGACQSGAQAVRKTIFEGVSGGRLRSFVVWIPRLERDRHTDAVRASEIFRDVDARQYWDGEKLLGHEIAQGLQVDGWVAWDIYLFYPPEAVWTDAAPPEPQALLVQTAKGVVAPKGTLPSKGDTSQLSPVLKERGDVVGTSDELAELLSQIAGRFSR